MQKSSNLGNCLKIIGRLIWQMTCLVRENDAVFQYHSWHRNSIPCIVLLVTFQSVDLHLAQPTCTCASTRKQSDDLQSVHLSRSTTKNRVWPRRAFIGHNRFGRFQCSYVRKWSLLQAFPGCARDLFKRTAWRSLNCTTQTRILNPSFFNIIWKPGMHQ